jgi:hypothetical protein
MIPDYRSDKSESLEGSGIAAMRWRNFHDAVPEDVWADIYFARKAAGWPDPPDPDSLDEFANDVPNELLEEINAQAIEDAELLGFYIAWHLAGGFEKLQKAGWHRTTIHRKMRRFRARYGTHPDEFSLPWLKLDLPKAWRASIVDQLHPEPYYEPSDPDGDPESYERH